VSMMPASVFVSSADVASSISTTPAPFMYRRKSKFKAKFESGTSYYCFKRLVPGAFKVGLIGSSCAASP